MEQKKSRARWIMLPLTAILLVAAMAAPLSAKYLKRTEDLVNTFSYAEVSNPEIDEKFENNIKEDVSVRVPDNKYPVYVRVSVVVTWKKLEDVTQADGTVKKEEVVYYKPPVEGTDYTITFTDSLGGSNDNKDWIDGTKFTNGENGYGYYYYRYLVPGGGKTTDLIKKCELVKGVEPPEGYTLSVEIITQTVQAVGYVDEDDPTEEKTPAYKDAWHIDFDLETTENPRP